MKVTAVLVACLVCVAAASQAEPESNRDMRIFAIYSTTSVTRLTTTTITAISTCLSTTSTACLGRRLKRSRFQLDVNFDDASLDTELEGTMAEDTRVARDVDRDGRKLTIWTTSFTTLTITSSSVLASTTVTASAICAAPGVTQGCFLG